MRTNRCFGSRYLFYASPWLSQCFPVTRSIEDVRQVPHRCRKGFGKTPAIAQVTFSGQRKRWSKPIWLPQAIRHF